MVSARRKYARCPRAAAAALRAAGRRHAHAYLEQNPGRSRERFHELSHGGGFLEILSTMVNQRGFYLTDDELLMRVYARPCEKHDDIR
jgi:predicted ATPase